MLKDRHILLIVGGGIAAYKSLDLVRRLRERGATVRGVLTAGGAQFVTPLALSALTEAKVHQELFDLTDEAEMGHIQLSRSADLIVVAPATADLMAKMTAGMCGDLASTLLLATDTPVLIAPAMNVRMWEHPATQANLSTLVTRGIRVIGPNEGNMACGEFGPGRMSEPLEIVAAIDQVLGTPSGPLAGKRAIVTSGPTHEPIDPVRYIANRSSGKQGHAIAAALAEAGAAVTLVSGPTQEPNPAGVTVVPIQTAREMLAACQSALPADIVVCAAAVADWRVASEGTQKLKKDGGGPPSLVMAENPDILATLAQPGAARPDLVIGFAAETENVLEHAAAKRIRKSCDWVLANDVSATTGTFGGDKNTVHVVTAEGVTAWPAMSKRDLGKRLARQIAEVLAQGE
ncbi:MAG: bifunctional phosphopantothenoylcysteine decarboxylase/phosphopantothenate--cysteine ligase CoaBC [Alphaproteobacteria bacterium]|nr:bifunctional phosphopantothenoylcysteine decarboxylase/phosphopantothenate--cysteine ligase CoaBC [Alphaproteobacteria bacterium]